MSCIFRGIRGLIFLLSLDVIKNEMDCFQDTKKLLNDYYRAMEGKILTDTSSEFIRIPLIDLTERRLSSEECKTKMYDKNGRTAAISKYIYICVGVCVNRKKNTCMNVLPLYIHNWHETSALKRCICV